MTWTSVLRGAPRGQKRESSGRHCRIPSAVWLLGGVCAAVAGTGCKNGDRAPHLAVAAAAEAGRWHPARRADVYFTTEVSGYMEPCGCTTKPLGGLQRLATVIRSGPEARALVDAGNLLFPPHGMNAVTREQHRLKAQTIARAYRQLGALALNVAEADLAEGIDLMSELQLEGAVPFVSANVRPNADGEGRIARSFVRVVGGIRFGFTGVATPEKIAAVAPGVSVLEYAPVVRGEVSSLRKQGAEVVVVLAHLGEGGARELAAAVPEIDVIIRAPGTPVERAPEGPVRVGHVIIAEAGSQGQHVGRMIFSFGDQAPERPLVLDDAGSKERQRRALLERKVKAFGMDADAWRSDPTKAEVVALKEAQIAQLEAQLAAPSPSRAAVDRPHVRIELIPLVDDIAADPPMSKLLAAYYAKLGGMNLEKGDPAQCAPKAKADAVFVGTAKCVECHEEAFAFWKKTPHARAWETLESAGKHFDLTCIGCHTIGWEQPGGFCRLKDVGILKDVGCESCHGPGSVHVVDQDPSSITLEAPEATCASGCHVPEHSDAFVYGKYVRKITGPGHVLSGD